MIQNWQNSFAILNHKANLNRELRDADMKLEALDELKAEISLGNR